MRNRNIVWLRFALLIGGLIWLGRAALEFARPNYYNPVSLLDYTAVVGTTLVYLFLGVVLWGFYLRYPLPIGGWKKSKWTAAILLTIGACFLAAFSNLIEDAFGIKTFGDLFFLGRMGTVLGLLLTIIGTVLSTNIRHLVWFLLACIIGVSFPDNGGWLIAGAAFLIYGWRVEGRNGQN